jgi:hypothetical protein
VHAAGSSPGKQATAAATCNSSTSRLLHGSVEGGGERHVVRSTHRAVEVHHRVTRLPGGGLGGAARQHLAAALRDAALAARHRARRHLVVDRRAAAAEQVALEVLAEGAADAVERNRVDARVAERQAEADGAEVVPESVVVLRRRRVVVEPQHEHVLRQEADGEHQHERQHRLGHLLARLRLPRLRMRLAWKSAACAHEEVARHQHVEAGDDAERRQVEHDEAQGDDVARSVRAPFLRERVAHLHDLRLADVEAAQVGADDGRQRAHRRQHPDAHGDAHCEFGGAAHVLAHRVHDGEVPAIRRIRVVSAHDPCEPRMREAAAPAQDSILF